VIGRVGQQDVEEVEWGGGTGKRLRGVRARAGGEDNEADADVPSFDVSLSPGASR